MMKTSCQNNYRASTEEPVVGVNAGSAVPTGVRGALVPVQGGGEGGESAVQSSYLRK